MVVFVGYSGFITWLAQDVLNDYLPFFGLNDYFIGLWFALASLDLAIEANTYWIRQKKITLWLKKIGIDRAILLTMLLFSILFSMMAVSNLETFYATEVIMTSLHLSEVFRHFFLFVAFTIQFFLIYASLYFFYWLNDKVLIPHILKVRGILVYAIAIIGSIALFFPILAQILVSLPLVRKAPALLPEQTLEVFTELNVLFPFIVIIFSLPIIVALQWFQQAHEITQLERQQVEQELNLLKQQINPHFFFNTLNNLYSLSLEKSDQSPEVILQLSELMRYVIYKGKEKEVSVQEEVNYLQDYLKLQKIRLYKKFDLTFEEDIAEHSMKIPPLLLIILLENAFKHGIEPAEGNCFLNIEVKSDAQRLVFRCENSFEPILSKHKGIGLENLHRRLELLFPDRHRLTTEAQGTTFTANLAVWTV
ncbi:MAG: hypothetical protein DHS20C18_55950 [Saprospiraceae bacterium]|nr:MAG: hypothetical protein DHS20C18_55950 [Saprospiraceae bacterium]